MIGLLRAQLEEMRRLQVRCELLASERARTLALLRGLWRHAAALGAPGDDADARERLAAVRAEIEAENQ
jgi:hypothetical protein